MSSVFRDGLIQSLIKMSPESPLYVAPGPTPGMTQPGNIDLRHRELAFNPDGSVSTVRSITIGTDKGQVLIPTVVNGKVVSDPAAIQHYQATGKHLGIFANNDAAENYAQRLHLQQARTYGLGGS